MIRALWLSRTSDIDPSAVGGVCYIPGTYEHVDGSRMLQKEGGMQTMSRRETTALRKTLRICWVEAPSSAEINTRGVMGAKA